MRNSFQHTLERRRNPNLDNVGVWVSTIIMAFFGTAVNTLKVVVTAIGAGVAVWGIINLLEGYGNDNPGANAHGS